MCNSNTQNVVPSLSHSIVPAPAEAYGIHGRLQKRRGLLQVLTGFTVGITTYGNNSSSASS